MTTKLLWGLIGISAAIAVLIALTLQAYLAAGLACVIGMVWIGLEVYGRSRVFNSAFFAALLGVAVFCAVKNASPVLILLGLTADLAAWDVSRFQVRISSETDERLRTVLEMKHLRRLASVMMIGMLVAVVPLIIRFSVSFVALCLIVLLALLALRGALLALNSEREQQA